MNYPRYPEKTAPPSFADMLHEFHTRPGVDISRPDAATLDVPGLYQRQAFLEEELRELHEALVARDLVAFADALGDIEYVVYGSAWRTGISWDVESLSPRHSSGVPTLAVSGLHVKLVLLGTAVYGMRMALDTHDLVGYTYELRHVDGTVRATARRTGIPLYEVVAEVHASNMTKIATPADGKAVKGPGYRPPDVAGVLARKRDAT
jgi:predicted HAD superfamily Cof-like phosphohydrolase